MLSTSGEDDDVALSGLLVCSCSYACARVAVEGSVRQILNLRISDFLLGVDHQDVASDRVHDERVSDCSTDIAGADDSDRGGELRV